MRWFGAIALAVSALAVAGCGKEEKPAAPVSGSAPAARAAEMVTGPDLEKVARAPRPFRLALVVKTRNNPFFSPMIREAEAQAKALGVELDVQAPPQESDKELQFSAVQNLVARGVDAILIAPADSRGIVPALMAAQQKGVVIINLDNRVDSQAAQKAGLALGGYVGADNESGGRLAGEAMAATLSGKTKVAILEGIRGADNAEARRRGFESSAGKLEIVSRETAEWDTEKAYTKFTTVLAAHPDLGGLFCANDKMAIGAMKAIAEAGRTKAIRVVGYDNIPDVKKYLASGAMTATIEQHPDLMGRFGVMMAVGVLTKSIPAGREYLVPLEVVNR